MTDLMSRFDAALGDIFSSPIVQLGIKAVGLYLVVLWLAAAVWAYRDMRNRSEMELVAYLAAALVTKIGKFARLSAPNGTSPV